MIAYMEKRGEISKEYAQKLRAQLKRKGVRFHSVLMREIEDCDSVVDVKRKQLWSLLQKTKLDPAQVSAAFDDIPDVVSMYRKFGIHAEVQPIHNALVLGKPKVH